MPAAGSAPNRALIPPGMKPWPPAVKLPPCHWVSSTMMARTGTATFHQVIDVVDPGEDAHGQEVDRGEDRHQHDGQDEADPGDVRGLRVVDAGPEVGGVVHEREALDRRDRDRLQVGEEAEPDAGQAAEREVREPARPAGDRVHRAEFRVGQAEDDHHDTGDGPGQDGGAAHRLRSVERTEQPAGSDDRCLGRPGGADQPQFPFKPDVSWACDGDPTSFSCHDRSFSDRAPQG